VLKSQRNVEGIQDTRRNYARVYKEKRQLGRRIEYRRKKLDLKYLNQNFDCQGKTEKARQKTKNKIEKFVKQFVLR
jgi:hypothetical protein